MKCRIATDTMVIALYGEAAEADRRELAVHLAGCPRCSKELEMLSSAAGTIARAEGHPVRAAIAAPSTRPPVPLLARRLIYAAAATLIFVVGGFAIRSRLLETGTAPSGAASTAAISRNGLGPARSVPAAAAAVASEVHSPYASEASVEAEISALDTALAKLESNVTEL